MEREQRYWKNKLKHKIQIKRERKSYCYCNKCVLSLTNTLVLNECLTVSMHGLYTSTQHLNKTLEPLNWIRVHPSHRDEHSCECSHVLYYVSCNISKYTTFKPHTRPSFRIFIPSNGSHLIAKCWITYSSLILRRRKVSQRSFPFSVTIF